MYTDNTDTALTIVEAGLTCAKWEPKQGETNDYGHAISVSADLLIVCRNAEGEEIEYRAEFSNRTTKTKEYDANGVLTERIAYRGDLTLKTLRELGLDKAGTYADLFASYVQKAEGNPYALPTLTGVATVGHIRTREYTSQRTGKTGTIAEVAYFKRAARNRWASDGAIAVPQMVSAPAAPAAPTAVPAPAPAVPPPAAKPAVAPSECPY